MKGRPIPSEKTPPARDARIDSPYCPRPEVTVGLPYTSSIQTLTMLGRTIFRSLKAVLNVVGVLMIVCGTLLGAYVGSQFEWQVIFMNVPMWVAVVLGLLAGFVTSFAVVAILFGVPFLLITMNEHLEGIRREHDMQKTSSIPLTPDLF
jgi:formate-dependent nitrite reductase membrane component NrfD